MTTSGDDSRTELAWREIVENFGERAVLPDDEPTGAAAGVVDPPIGAGDRSGGVTEDAGPGMAEDAGLEMAEEDDVDVVDEVAEVDRFRPPTPPPLPRPRTWQRGVAWAGLFVAPLLALVIALFSIYVTPLVGWALLAWFVGGFGYLVREMPRSPRDPWDDGSRV